jgi:hypothetical protein
MYIGILALFTLLGCSHTRPVKIGSSYAPKKTIVTPSFGAASPRLGAQENLVTVYIPPTDTNPTPRFIQFDPQKVKIAPNIEKNASPIPIYYPIKNENTERYVFLGLCFSVISAISGVLCVARWFWNSKPKLMFNPIGKIIRKVS